MSTMTASGSACVPAAGAATTLGFMRQVRTAIPARRPIYWIQDNLSANWTPDIRDYAATNKIDLVATPTHASYLNPVECHLFPISEFVVRNADLRRLGRLRLGPGPPRPPSQRPPPRQAHHHPRSPPSDRRLMRFPVTPSEKGH